MLTKVPGGTVHKLPVDLKKVLLKRKKALAVWNDITPLARNEWICWVEGAKANETRDRRLHRTYTELEEGMRRPCCWPGCFHRVRNGKTDSPRAKGVNPYANVHAGFTIVELVIVIVVIAILAIITGVSYKGITDQARETSLKTEASQAADSIELYVYNNRLKTYPGSIDGMGISLDPNTVYYYTTNANATGYCFSATTSDGLTYSITSSTTGPKKSKCIMNVATYAGTGTAGSSNTSVATTSTLNNPTSAVVAPNGDMYIADYGNNMIRKITAAGVVSTVAGATTSGSTNANGTAARFYAPGGITMDSVGNLYVADQFNSLIRKVDTSGNVTTFAGSSYGYVNGTGTAAKFQYPWSVAADASDNIYVADTYRNVIRKITPAGVVSLLAGSTTGTSGYQDGTGSTALFNYPSGIAVGPDNNIYVADQDNNRIRKITPAGVVTTLAGSGTKGTVDGSSSTAQFASPHGITIDPNGNIYVADEYSNAVRKIAPNGSVYTIAGNDATAGFANGTSDIAKFNHPIGLAVAPNGSLYVVERNGNRIRIITY